MTGSPEKLPRRMMNESLYGEKELFLSPPEFPRPNHHPAFRLSSLSICQRKFQYKARSLGGVYASQRASLRSGQSPG